MKFGHFHRRGGVEGGGGGGGKFCLKTLKMTPPETGYCVSIAVSLSLLTTGLGWARLGWAEPRTAGGDIDIAGLGWAGPRTAGGDIDIAGLGWAGLDQERPETLLTLLGWPGWAGPRTAGGDVDIARLAGLG